MVCPNCGRDAAGGEGEWAPTDSFGHWEGCLLSTLLTVLADRGLNVADADLNKVDVDVLWDRYGGPAADFVAQELGLGRA